MIMPLFPFQANVFDTAGGERFRTLTSNYFQHTDAAILMYAVDDQRSLERLYDEADNALKFIEPDTFVWAVVGNKADLRPEVEETTAKALTNHVGAKLFFYTSAKTGLNVAESMDTLVRALHRKVTRGGHIHSQSLRGQQAIRIVEERSDVAITSATTSTKTTCCN